jgi:hypothetical protein
MGTLAHLTIVQPRSKLESLDVSWVEPLAS